MKRIIPALCMTVFVSLFLFSLASAGEMPADKAAPEGFQSLFDGKTLDGWDGDPAFWSVQDGCITGISTAETPVKYNTFLTWTKGEVADFELLCDFCLTNHNSGIQYRAFKNEKPWSLGGYQADIAGPPHMGIVYGEGYRGILCQRGDQTTIGKDGKQTVTGKVGDKNELLDHIDLTGWNTYRIVAKGNVLTQYINGYKVSELIDEDAVARFSGVLGFQMHVGPAMKVQFKNIFLKELK
ncbi:MAG: DUF1080 domain-containing protein [Thermoguttaceae bacterium]|nr:DUF1080 domain-containing protein [Thermoguttaceae bacterium]